MSTLIVIVTNVHISTVITLSNIIIGIMKTRFPIKNSQRTRADTTSKVRGVEFRAVVFRTLYLLRLALVVQVFANFGQNASRSKSSDLSFVALSEGTTTCRKLLFKPYVNITLWLVLMKGTRFS